jgi:MoaA/NifB/PqqE/SkfB family radical SAM enzyme
LAEDFDILNDYNGSRRCVDKGSICHAAESSMYFGRDGYVSACCYSRSSPLGRYPEQSIEEIWSGVQAKSMRATLRRNEFPGGCELCADQFYARNFSGFLAQQFDSNARPLRAWGLMSRSRRLPVRFEFELSNKCNLECAMCSGFFSSSIRANREGLPPLPQMYDQAFVDQLVPFLPHLTNAKFLGGEPFLVDLYYDIWEHLIETNPKCVVSITTNGTVYTKKVRRVMEKLNCEVIVSLDSVTKTTYESIRRNASLARTLRNLQAFSAINRQKGKSLTLAICPMTSNYREIPGLVEFANERGMRIFFNTVVFPAAQSINALPAAVQREILDFYRESNPSPHTEIESANCKALEGLCRQIEFWMKEEPPSARPQLERICAELLAIGTESSAVACVLSDLAGCTVRAAGHIEEADPVHELKGYYRAIWSVGGMLQSSGMLKNLRFAQDDLQAFLLYLDNRLGPEQARRLRLESRRFSSQMLSYCGTLPAERLIELVESHLAPSAQSPLLPT